MLVPTYNTYRYILYNIMSLPPVYLKRLRKWLGTYIFSYRSYWLSIQTEFRKVQNHNNINYSLSNIPIFYISLLKRL